MAVTVTSNENEKKEMYVEEEEEEEKWVNHYSSKHQILLVGDGDFSFSLSLAQSFGSASNIVASSLDSYVEVTSKYPKAESNLQNLEKLGASHLHGVDATKMKLHTDLKMRKFDRIIFSFPHAGFRGREHDASLISKHRKLVSSFFANAKGMLKPFGEVHVNHKTKPPFCCWNLEELASENSLALIECVAFKKEDYPGYSNKRGDGSRCNEPFYLGKCSTFKFIFCPSVNKSMVRAHICSRDEVSHLPPHLVSPMHDEWAVYPKDGRSEQPHEVPYGMQQRPWGDSSRYPSQQHLQFPSGVNEWDVYSKDRRFEQVSYGMQQRPWGDYIRYPSHQHLQVPSRVYEWPVYSEDRRFGQPYEVPSLVEQRPFCGFYRYPSRDYDYGRFATSYSSPLYLGDGRSYQVQEAPFRRQDLSISSGFDVRMNNMPLYLRDGRSYQPQEAPSRMQHLSASLGLHAGVHNTPLSSRDILSYRTPEAPSRMQHLSASLGLHGSMHRTPEAPSRMQHLSASLGLHGSMHRTPEAPSRMQHLSASLGLHGRMHSLPLSSRDIISYQPREAPSRTSLCFIGS